MPVLSTSVAGHSISIEASMISGFERIRCDGEIVSEKKSWFYTPPRFRP